MNITPSKRVKLEVIIIEDDMKDTWLKDLKDLLNDPKSGLKESSDTNKTRSAILGLFEYALDKQKTEFLKAVGEDEDSDDYGCDDEDCECNQIVNIHPDWEARNALRAEIRESIKVTGE